MDAAIACGMEQHAALPVLAFLALGAVGYSWYNTLAAARSRAGREWLRRRASQIRSDTEASKHFAKLAGSSPVVEETRSIALVPGTSDGETLETARGVARALGEDRVLLVDLPEYLAARARLRLVSKMLAGACLVAAVLPGGTDLIYGLCRLLLVALVWADHAARIAPLEGGTGASICDRATTAALSAVGLGSRATLPPAGSGEWRYSGAAQSGLPLRTEGGAKGPDARGAGAVSVLQCLGPPAPLASAWRRGRAVVLHFGVLGALAWFACARQPELQGRLCTGASPPPPGVAQALIAERAAAMGLLMAWLLLATGQVALLRCEACVWLAPRAEELLAPRLEADSGFVLGGAALDLAEALCDGRVVAESLLRELSEAFGIAVLDGSCSRLFLPPAPRGPGPVTAEDLSTLRDELSSGLARSHNASEAGLGEVLQATEAVLHSLERRQKWAGISDELQEPQEKQPRGPRFVAARKSIPWQPALAAREQAAASDVEPRTMLALAPALDAADPRPPVAVELPAPGPGRGFVAGGSLPRATARSSQAGTPEVHGARPRLRAARTSLTVPRGLPPPAHAEAGIAEEEEEDEVQAQPPLAGAQEAVLQTQIEVSADLEQEEEVEVDDGPLEAGPSRAVGTHGYQPSEDGEVSSDEEQPGEVSLPRPRTRESRTLSSGPQPAGRSSRAEVPRAEKREEAPRRQRYSVREARASRAAARREAAEAARPEVRPPLSDAQGARLSLVGLQRAPSVAVAGVEGHPKGAVAEVDERPKARPSRAALRDARASQARLRQGASPPLEAPVAAPWDAEQALTARLRPSVAQLSAAERPPSFESVSAWNGSAGGSPPREPRSDVGGSPDTATSGRRNDWLAMGF
uniref:Uncharacterized protein n=1 Tax=Alexandrium monilatum TaxID=311494 RepID=A0A7S4VKP8_9DINO